MVVLSQSILETRRISHLHGSALIITPLKTFKIFALGTRFTWRHFETKVKNISFLSMCKCTISKASENFQVRIVVLLLLRFKKFYEPETLISAALQKLKLTDDIFSFLQTSSGMVFSL